MVNVHITAEEFARCVVVGMRRFVSSSVKGHNHASTYERTFYARLEEETVGAVGEYAFCKYHGYTWEESVDTFHSVPDVGTKFEVRATRRDDGCLIVRENDPEDRVYILVTGTAPEVVIRGWVWGREAKQPQFLKNPSGYRPAWFVPQGNLRKLKADE